MPNGITNATTVRVVLRAVVTAVVCAAAIVVVLVLENLGPSKKRMTVSLERIVWRKQDSPTNKLHPGLYSFLFQFVLPRDRTFSSFEEQFGWIRYYIQAKIDNGMLGNLFSRSQNITEVLLWHKLS